MSASFSILTPTLNPGPLLACCARSVADQGTEQLSVTHHIRDGGSTDGSLADLPRWAGLDVVTAPDQGMYDALNRAWATATGDYVGLLNADEQYQPGVLAEVVATFQQHPEWDILYAGFIVADAHWQPLCYRRPLLPSARFVAVAYLPVFTCATFLRRAAFRNWPTLFDTRYRAAADADWFLRMKAAGIRMGTLNQFTSAFMLDGRNLSLSSGHVQECAAITAHYARHWRWAKSWIKKYYHVRKTYYGHFAAESVTLQVYRAADAVRTAQVARLTGRWPLEVPVA